MANVIRIKRRAGGGAAGAPVALATSELAHNEADDTLYIGFGDDGGGVATSIKAVAGGGAFLALSGAQTVVGVKDFAAVPTISGVLALADNSTKAATTTFVKGQGFLTANQVVTVTGDASGSGATAITLTLAAVGTPGTYTKVTTDSKGRVTAGDALLAGDIPTLTVAKLSDFTAQVQATRLDQLAAPIAGVGMNAQRLTGLAEPVDAQDAATKNYVDLLAQGLDPKASVRAATTAPLTLSGTQVVDGVSLNPGDRVLVLNQGAPGDNGIYVVAAGAWTRALDADTWAKLVSAFVFVEEGTANADIGYVSTVDQGGTLGVTAVAFVQFAGAGAVSAGAGLSMAGSVLNVNVDDASVEINTNALRIKPTWPGHAGLNTVGFVTTGAWQADVVEMSWGGTGRNGTTDPTGSMYKKSAANSMAIATPGTDYLDNQSMVVGGTF